MQRSDIWERPNFDRLFRVDQLVLALGGATLDHRESAESCCRSSV